MECGSLPLVEVLAGLHWLKCQCGSLSVEVLISIITYNEIIISIKERFYKEEPDKTNSKAYNIRNIISYINKSIVLS